MGDVVGEERRNARRQRGGDGATLMPPFLALAQEKAAADDRTQDANAGRRAAIVGGIVDQDMMNGLGRVEQNALPAQEPVDQDVLLIGPLRPHGERIAAQGPQEAIPVEVPCLGHRPRRVEQLGCCGHAHGAAKTWAVKSSASRFSSGPSTRSSSTGGTMARSPARNACRAGGAWRWVA